MEKEYLEKAEKWFVENLGEKRKDYAPYNDVIMAIAEEIKAGKEPNYNVHYYSLTTD